MKGFFKHSFDFYQSQPGLNQSTIKQILANPQKWANGFAETPRSAALNFGAFCHDCLLSPQEIPDKYLLADIEKLDLRLKAHKELQREADERGLILVDNATIAHAKALISANDRTLKEYFQADGDRELSFYGSYLGETPIHTKARFDFISSNRCRIVDLKIMQNADKANFAAAVAKFGYHIQAAYYMDVIGETPKPKEFIFVAIEKEPPYLCGIYRLSQETIDLGRERYKKAVRIFKNKPYFSTQNYYEVDLEFDTVEREQTITLPAYAFYE